MKSLIDSIKAVANYLSPVIDDDKLLDAIDSGKLIIDDNNMLCVLVGNIARMYLIFDEEVDEFGFGEFENEFVFPVNILGVHYNLIIIYLPL